MGSLNKVKSALFIICAFATAIAHADSVERVTTEAGVYQGHSSSHAAGVTVFKGIGYAAPPVGDLRWKPPADPVPFAGIKQATAAGPACWQAQNSDASLYSRGNLTRSEDCLYLNVFTGAADSGDNLPVMVWFHGGGNTAGHGAPLIFDGSNLAARGAVIVTANYRLGPLGFLAHPGLTSESENNSSGNYGLLDQIDALQWVQANISNFGGDPDRVTIFGQSAGGTDVCLLMSSPQTEGLISGVIGQSPGCIKDSRMLTSGDNSGHDAGEQYARALGITGSDANAVSQLRDVSAQRLIETPGGSVGPLIDGWVIPEAPYDLMAAGRNNRIPVMVGGLADEYYGLSHTAGPITEAQLDNYLAAAFGDAAATIKQTYSAELAESPLDARKTIQGDNGFLLSSRLWGRLVAERGDDAYVYFFDQAPPVYRLYTPDNPDLTGEGRQRLFGAYHSGELAYVFDNLDLVGLDWSAADRRLSETIADYWVNFARSGNPNGPGLPQWPAYDPEQDVVQILGQDVHSGIHPRHDRLMQLEEIFLRQR